MNEMLNMNNNLSIWLTRARDRMMDFKLGINTRGLEKVSVPDSEVYMTLPYKDIMQILFYIELKPTDIFIDIGCGKGRVLCCAALFHIKKVIGIEHAPEMSAKAQENALLLRGRKSPVSIFNVDATKFDYNEGTIFYMYNPFNQSVMTSLLDKVYESLQRKKRSIKIIYANPLYESSLSECVWLKMYDKWEIRSNESGKLNYQSPLDYLKSNGRAKRNHAAVPVSFWQTKDEFIYEY